MFSKRFQRGKHPRFEFAPRDDRSSKNEPKRAENDRATSLQSWECLTLFLPRWEGEFPDENTARDGHVGPAEVDAYAPNAFGIYNALGNVWEWCAGGTPDKRPMRGGSFVDTVDGRYNHALRCATRMDQTADSGSQNTGFRCAADHAASGEL